MPDSGSVGRTRSGRQAIRTCVGCRQRDARDSLIRLVASVGGPDGVVVIDTKKCLPGRGAWVHAACVRRALDRRALGRAFRLRTAPSVSAEVLRKAQEGANRSSIVDMESGLEADGHPMSTQR
ncbi:YlxR family protein [Rarobacter incanus]|uniref:YlxR domain-containing protein n=1 Tax=Rarobacter incanus TaxID=153494 RepID=A0A542SLD9_9MICO|nr:YlxR family protein [Rarobacter incanus]TQK75443.1 hypothetical protein FB389_0069 [Rarobacter incanus]